MRRLQERCSFFLWVCLAVMTIAGEVPAAQTLPITFEANRGQAPTQYAYVFHRDGLSAGFFRNAVEFDLTGPLGAASKVRLTLLGGDADPEAQDVLAGHGNYFTGSDASRWVRNVPLSREVEYGDVYPGISVRFYGNGSELEHDFCVRPGADASRIVMHLDGTARVKLSADGNLKIHADGALLTLRRPVAYQETQHGRKAVQAQFVLAKDRTIRFALGKYDRSRLLVIDPVFVFSTFLAGTGVDRPTAITTDAAGNIYVAGYTASTDFPVEHPVQPTLGACTAGLPCYNAFISKLDPTGTNLIYSTYLGGSSQDFADAIRVDANGNAIIAGYANSTDFPQAGAISAPSSCTGAACYFMASLTADGSSLNYSGKVGGGSGASNPTNSPNGPGLPLAVDSDGNAYLASVTQDPEFQTTAGTLSTTPPGYADSEMFVLKVNPSGSLLYSTLVPGNASEPYTNVLNPAGIVVDASGNVTTSGTTDAGMPTTAGVVAPQFPNVTSASAGFVLQLNAAATAINFASYLPGTDMAGGMTVDKQGNYWIVGTTTETTLPVGPLAYMKAPTAGSYVSVATTGYILELSADATMALNATYLDGTGVGQIWEVSEFTAVALDSHSNVFVGGFTYSADFPLQNPLVTISNTSTQNLILAQMDPALSTLKFGSFLSSANPGDGGSTFSGMTIDGSDNLIVAGVSAESFPTTTGSFQPQPPANSTSAHGFLSKIDMTPAPSLCLAPAAGIDFGSVQLNASSSQSFTVKNCGNATLNMYSAHVNDANVAVALNCGAMPPGAVCSGTLTLKPLDAGQLNGWVTFGDDASSIPQAIYWSGYGNGDPSINAQPILTGISPGFTKMGGGGPQLTLTGTGFANGATVYWGSTALSTQVSSAEQLTASVLPANVAAAGIGSITVKNPSPGGGTSNALQMEVDSAGSGVSAPAFEPSLSKVIPGGSAAYEVTLPSGATNVSVKCLNLPQGATCSYAGGTVTITTSTSTPGGTYPITVVFTETLSTAAGSIMLPFLLPLAWSRRKSRNGAFLIFCIGIASIIVATAIGCGGGGSNSTGTGGSSGSGSTSQAVTSSGTVTLVVQ